MTCRLSTALALSCLVLACGGDETSSPGADLSADTSEDTSTPPDLGEADTAPLDTAPTADVLTDTPEPDDVNPEVDAGPVPPPLPPLDPRAGTRLKPVGLRAGGLESLTGIFDTALGERCFFVPSDASGTSFHCLGSGSAEIRWSDAGCTDELLQVFRPLSFGCGEVHEPRTGDVVGVWRAEACGDTRNVALQLGAGVNPGVVYRREQDGIGCIAEEVEEDALYFEAATLSPGALVTATLEAVQTAEAGLVVAMLAGSDGSRFPYQLRWDDGEACYPGLVMSPDGERRCVPSAAISAASSTWSDDACASPVFPEVIDTACPLPPAPRHGITLRFEDSCLLHEDLHTLGPTITETFTGSPATCTQSLIEWSDDWRLHSAAARLDWSEVPLVRRERVGAGRLRLERDTDLAGNHLSTIADSQWWDEVLGRYCSDWVTPDGKTRCIPTDALDHEFIYADADCTVPVVLDSTQGCYETNERQRYRAVVTWTDCGAQLDALHRLVPHASSLYAEGAGGCEEVFVDESLGAFVDGTTVDLTTFPELEPFGPEGSSAD